MVRAVAFSPDSWHVLTASADHAARVRSLGCEWKFHTSHHGDAIISAAFCPQGVRIVTISGNSGCLWDVHHDSCVRLFRPWHMQMAVYTLDGQFVWTGHGMCQALWHAVSSKQWLWLDSDDSTSCAFSNHPGQDCVR